jgi:hypothetical protein
MYVVMRSPALMEDAGRYEFNGAFNTYAEAVERVKKLTGDGYWSKSDFLIFEEPALVRPE